MKDSQYPAKFLLLTPAHKGWVYSRPLRHPGSEHEACSTA